MRKRLLAIIATAAMVVTMIPNMVFAETVTEINNVNDLKKFAESVNAGESYAGKTVTLNVDLDISGIANWDPIGNGSRSGKTYTGDAFNGTFDGKGNTIKGLTISSTTGADAALGLFGVVDGGVVKNLVLTDVKIDVTASECAGGAIGLMVNNSLADKITVSGKVKANRGNGGIVGRMTVSGTISNCINNADITATGTGGNTGGIVGAAYYTETGKEMTIDNCANNGAVKGYNGVGGIVGLSSANVDSCVNSNTAEVIGNGFSIGGIVGEQQNYGSILDCKNDGDIVNNGSNTGYGTGGIVGWIRYNGAEASYPQKEIVEVIGNINNGSISGASDAGGIIGTAYNAVVVKNNENNAERLDGANFAAGIVGNLQFTETPVGNIPSNSTDISNNVSKTPEDKISANCKDPYGYNNNTSQGRVDYSASNNDVWVAQVGDTKYATFDKAIEAADREKKDLVILDMDGNDELNNVPAGVNVVNKTGENISVNGTTVPPTKNEPVAPTPSKPVDSPATGDNSALPFAVAGITLAAMAAVVATRRREN